MPLAFSISPLHFNPHLKALAVERKRPDLAMELSSAEWQVQRVSAPGETFISQAKQEKVPPGVRDLGSELHSLLDDILKSPNTEAVEATESTLRFFASCARRYPGSGDLPLRRRG